MSEIGRFNHGNNVANIVQYVNERYLSGNVTGVIVILQNEDKTFDALWSDIPFIERIGLLETAKMTINNVYEE